MKLIICTDNNMGISFNHRRQSRDRILQQHILTLCRDSRLWMTPYSYPLFCGEKPGNIAVDADCLRKAGKEDYCFAEGCSLASYEDRIQEIILFRWNRKYPADLFFDIPLEEHGWILYQQEEFPGSSHKKITKEVYVR